MTDALSKAKRAVDALPGGDGPAPARQFMEPHPKLRRPRSDRNHCVVWHCQTPAAWVWERMVSWCEQHRPDASMREEIRPGVQCVESGCTRPQVWHAERGPSLCHNHAYRARVVLGL